MFSARHLTALRKGQASPVQRPQSSATAIIRLYGLPGLEAAGSCGHDGTALTQFTDELLGTTIGTWRITRILGEGGMGRVYKAVQPSIGSRVAIKVITGQPTPDLVDRFFAEARAVNLIRHEQIVNVLSLDRLPDGKPYIVME